MNDDIAVWRQKKLLNGLKNAIGNGTSMISLIIPPKDQISRFTKMLTDEYGTASNIKSRVNRLSVLSAITSAQHKLKTYSKTPPNGLGIFVGNVLTEKGEKKVNLGIEPIRPINTSLYLCDSKFHVDDFLALFENEYKYGIIVIDGHMTLFSILQGNVKIILQNLHVDLPKKHGRGGQSSVRFARLRVERRHAYVKKVAEIMTNLYISDNQVNVEGIILAGHSDLKNQLSAVLDQRIKNVILKTVDTNYGGENGLNECIELCSDVLKDVRFSKEKKILQEFFNSISVDSGKFFYTLKSTMNFLEMGCVETLIIYEGLTTKVYVGEDNKISLCNAKEKNEKMGDNENWLTEGEEILFVDWIAENYGSFGCSLHFVSDKSEEGTQFVEGFGGVGGIARYRIEMSEDLSDYSSCGDDDIF